MVYCPKWSILQYADIVRYYQHTAELILDYYKFIHSYEAYCRNVQKVITDAKDSHSDHHEATVSTLHSYETTDEILCDELYEDSIYAKHYLGLIHVGEDQFELVWASKKNLSKQGYHTKLIMCDGTFKTAPCSFYPFINV